MANFINNLFGRLSIMERQMRNMEEKIRDNSNSNNYPNSINYFFNWRSYNGAGNNLSNPEWGKANITLLRQASSDYADGKSSLAVRGANNPNPRIVSNLLCKTNQNIPSIQGLTDMMWMWGQFLDHEIDLTEPQSNGETANMTTPTKTQDPNEDFPGRTIAFDRSHFVVNSDPRQQPNNISSYIDGTNVYGFNSDRAYALRRLDGSGKFKTTISNNGETLLPYNIDELINATPHGSNPKDFFLAGDIRSNENIFLTAMHTLFVREHNRLCDVILDKHPEYQGKDELIYQYARKLVIGMMCYITYDEFLPHLLDSFPIYSGYDENVNASIKTEFSTVGYRLGHSMLSSSLRIGPNPGDTILLRDAYFTPSYLQTNGIDNILLGGTLGTMQEIDTRVVEDIRSFLFGAPTAQNLLDLASLNMQRGRDHGIPDYNTLRAAYGLTKVTLFDQITSNTTISNGLSSLYNTVDDIDPWIGGLAEDHLSGSNVGPLFNAIIKDQFIRLRDGDRYYYKNDNTMTVEDIELIESSTLGKIIERNTGLSNLGDVFRS